MGEQSELEVVIESADDEIVGDVERALAPADVSRWEPARVVDPLTVLAVAGGIVQLVEGLLSLRDRLRARPSAPMVRLRNAEGHELALDTATPEDLRALLAGGPAAENTTSA